MVNKCVFSVISESLQPQGLSRSGSSVRGISPARILEWAAISNSRGCSQHRDCTRVSCVGRQILYYCAPWEAQGINVRMLLRKHILWSEWRPSNFNLSLSLFTPFCFLPR